MTDQFNMREEKVEDVKALFRAANKRRENKVRYHLLAKLLKGDTINLTKDDKLYTAVNKEKMEFEQILNLNSQEVKNTIEYVKNRREEQKKVGGRWYNPNSKAFWGEKGAVPPCCYYARPAWYWQDKKLTNSFFNTFPVFRIGDKRL